MKKLIGLGLSILFSATLVLAQDSGKSEKAEKAGTASSSPFQKGTNYVSLRMGVAPSSYYKKNTWGINNYNSNTPIFTLAYENGISDLAGIGYIGLGVEGGYSFAKQEDDMDSNYDRSSLADFYHLGFRTNYHVDFHMLTKEPFFEKFDAYVGLGFFFRFENRVYKGDNNEGFEGEYQYFKTNYIFDACLGARYFLKDNLALMAQFGSGVSHFDFGATLKL